MIMKCYLVKISGIARCFTFGGSRHRVLYDPNIPPRSDLSKEKYMKKDEQTTLNHFYEKLLKLKDLMKTQVKTNSCRSFFFSLFFFLLVKGNWVIPVYYIISVTICFYYWHEITSWITYYEV